MASSTSLLPTDFGNNASVLLGKGDGTFQAPVTYDLGNLTPGPSNNPIFIAAGDFNGDGRADLGHRKLRRPTT